MPDERTFEDFMDDMISNCRTPIEIWTVAKNTRWAGQADEAQRIAEKRAGKKTHKNESFVPCLHEWQTYNV